MRYDSKFWIRCVGGAADGRLVYIENGDRWPYVAADDNYEYVIHWYEIDMDDDDEDVVYRFIETELWPRHPQLHKVQNG